MSVIRKETIINAPLDVVYAFARDPFRWNEWWVGLRTPEEVNGHGEAGTIVRHHYSMAGIPFPVTSRVTEDTRTPNYAHWKGTIEGPLDGWHEWTYKAEGNKTRVNMEITYTVPGKGLGKIVDKLVIEQLQERALDHTMENLKIICEAEVPAHV